MQPHSDALGAGRCTPTSETAHVASAGRIEGQQKRGTDNFRVDGTSRQAADVIEGEEFARAYLDRLREGMTQPGELAVIVAFMGKTLLHGFCRLIEEALEGRHHA